MMTFISCAKTMTDHSKVEVPTTGTPQFQAEAIQHALGMSRFSAEELERLLRVNSKIAAENYLRFQDFCSEANKALPALLAYTGIVFNVSVLKTLQQKIFNTYKIICVSLPFYMDYFVRLT